MWFSLWLILDLCLFFLLFILVEVWFIFHFGWRWEGWRWVFNLFIHWLRFRLFVWERDVLLTLFTLLMTSRGLAILLIVVVFVFNNFPIFFIYFKNGILGRFRRYLWNFAFFALKRRYFTLLTRKGFNFWFFLLLLSLFIHFWIWRGQ